MKQGSVPFVRVALATLCMVLRAEQGSATELTIFSGGADTRMNVMSLVQWSLLSLMVFLVIFMMFLCVWRHGYRAGMSAFHKKFEIPSSLMIAAIEDKTYNTAAGSRIHLSDTCMYLQHSKVMSTKICSRCLGESRVTAEMMIESHHEKNGKTQ